MNEVIIVLACIIFFYIGKYSQTTKEKDIVKSIGKKIANRPSIEPIHQKTKEERAKEGTVEEVLEKEANDFFSQHITK